MGPVHPPACLSAFCPGPCPPIHISVRFPEARLCPATGRSGGDSDQPGPKELFV